MVRLFTTASLLAAAHAASNSTNSTTATTPAPSVVLDHAALVAQFQAWKASPAGQYAVTNGLSRAEAVEITPKDAELQAFAETLATVAELNAKYPSATFSANNPFAAMTNAQFAAWVKKSAPPSAKDAPANADALPASTTTKTVDWTTSGCVAPVKNQGSCGSCFAHAAVAAAESAVCLANNRKLTVFSDQQVLSCGPGNGCGGGWSNLSLEWIAKNGMCTAEAYPYTDTWSNVASTCQATCTRQPMPFTEIGNTNGEVELAEALDRQPVAVDVSSSSPIFKNYERGVLTAGCNTDIDHVILGVGYGVDGNLPYFKFKNSWGSWWGEDGYVRLQRGVGGRGTCGLAGHATYPVLAKPTFGLVTAKGVVISEFYSGLYANAAVHNANEAWRYDSATHQLIVGSNNECLDAFKDGGKFGVHTYKCDAANTNQQWTIDTANRRIKHRAHPNLCLDVDPAQQNKVQVWTCYDGAVNQQIVPTQEKVKLWTFNNKYMVSTYDDIMFTTVWGAPYEWVVNNVDNTWRARGDYIGGGDRCLDAYEPRNGGAVHLWACDSANGNQKWQYDPTTKQLRHLKHKGFCLDMRNDNGDKAHLWACNAPANNLQKFRLESLSFTN